MYRANLFAWMIVGAIGPLIMVSVWLSILGEQSAIGGYARGDFILYYLLTTIGWYVVGGEFARPIGEAIRSGDINKSLLQPYDVILGKAVWEQAWKLLSLILSLPVFFLILYLMRDMIVFTFDPSALPVVILSLLFGAIIFALIQAIVGIMAFWVTEIWPMVEVNDILIQLMGGMLAPMTLLPQLVQRISEFLPYRYIFFEPVAIILGKQPNPGEVILKQFGFIVLLFIAYKLIWRAGLKRYEGIGG
jgi:ABC-2 type transport system permease protein